MTSGSTGRFALVSPTPRDIAATLFRHPRLVLGTFGMVLLASLSFILCSPGYQSHFRVLLRHGRFDPVVSAQPSSMMDFVRPEITEEELNSEVELLRGEDLLKQVVIAANLIPAGLTDSERAVEIERTLRKVQRRLEINGIKKSNFIRVTIKTPIPHEQPGSSWHFPRFISRSTPISSGRVDKRHSSIVKQPKAKSACITRKRNS